jgi:hypothetical protein
MQNPGFGVVTDLRGWTGRMVTRVAERYKKHHQHEKVVGMLVI